MGGLRTSLNNQYYAPRRNEDQYRHFSVRYIYFIPYLLIIINYMIYLLKIFMGINWYSGFILEQ